MFAILSCQQLRFLNVSHNKLNTVKCTEIVSELAEQSISLTVLDISYTQLINPLDVVKAAKNSLSL